MSDSGKKQKQAGWFSWSLRYLLLFTILAAVLSYDEIRYPATVPLKSTTVPTVPLLNAWIIGWNAQQAKDGFKYYWDAPIFHPAEKSFAFSEPQPATLLVAPVVYATGNPIVAYKVWHVLSLALNGFFAALLIRRLGYFGFFQTIGGLAMVLLPVIHQRIDVLQLVPVWGILWFWSSLFKLNETPNWKTAIETGVAFGMCFALCVHHALFLSLLIPFAALVFLDRIFSGAFLAASIGAVVIAGIMILPIVVPIRTAVNENEFSRSEKLVTKGSVKPEHYLASPDNALLKMHRFKAGKARQLCVGWARILMAMMGVSFGIFVGERKRWVLFLTITGLMAWSFSQGLDLKYGDWQPWKTLCETLPGFSQVRSVYRFAWFVQMAIVLLAIEGLFALNYLRKEFLKGFAPKTAWLFLLFVPGVLIAVEVVPEVARRGGVPDYQKHAKWGEFVRENTPDGKAIACLPFSTGTTVKDYAIPARWMYKGLNHRVPMVNGYSGFFPQDYCHLRDLVNAEWPSANILNKFAENDVELIVVERPFMAPEEILAIKSNTHSVELVLEDPSGTDVYRLISADQERETKPVAEPPPPTETDSDERTTEDK